MPRSEVHLGIAGWPCAVSIGLVITPLLAVLTGSLDPAELNDATTLFSISQRIAGSLGVGLIAAIYASRAATSGATPALHLTGVLAAPLLPAERNQLRYDQ